MADPLLLGMLRDQLTVLDRPGSEASLHMGHWCSCLAGYALRNTAFNNLGLRWHRAAITFGSDTYFDALGRFFDLAPWEVDYLFGDHPTATGFDRITTFVEAILRIDDILEEAFNWQTVDPHA